MVFDGFLLISFYFFVFILPGTGIIFGIIELKNRTSNKNAVSKKENNRFGIYGIVPILFIIFLLFFPIHTVLSLKYSKPESLLNYFEKNFDYFEKYSFGYMPYTTGKIKLNFGAWTKVIKRLEIMIKLRYYYDSDNW